MIEAEILRRLLAELKATPIVTLAGRGGAYEYIERRITDLEGESR